MVKNVRRSKRITASAFAGLLAISVCTSVVSADLSKGDYGDEVASLQRQLSNLGYYSGTIDGDYGSFTENAVIQFQSDAGLYVDGYAGPITLAAISGALGENVNSSDSVSHTDEEIDTGISVNGAYSFGSITLSFGSSGSIVSLMQKALQQLGFYDAVIDGDYGNMTVNSVTEFQSAYGLYADGVAGPITLGKLENIMGGAGPVQSVEDGSAKPNGIVVLDLGSGTLSFGSSGNYVSALQSSLQLLGFYDGVIDGDYGNMTVNSVKSYQSAMGLYVDGVAGPITLNSIVQSIGADDGNASEDSQSKDEAVLPAGLIFGKAYIISNSSGTVNVVGASVDAAAGIELAGSNGESSQKWILQDAGNGYFYLRNLKSWKCLDVSEGKAVQNDVDQAASPLWKIEKTDAGGYTIMNANGTYLNASGANAAVSGSSIPWSFTETNTDTAIDYSTDGTQSLGIRTYAVYHGLLTQTTGYYDIQTSIDLPSGGYYLSSGDNYSIGLKVIAVNNFLVNNGYLSSAYYNYTRYLSDTAYAVMQFQSDYGLVVDGMVGMQTWLAMGYSEEDFYNLGSYVTDLKVLSYGSSRDTYVNAMLSTAEEYYYAGTGYKEGTSGQPGTWVDCSGLIYQCLYSAGINPDTNIIDHARVVYEYTSAYLAADSQLGNSVSYLETGDLVFYGSSSVNHVGIYAGNGMIYDSYPGLGVTYRSVYAPGNILKIVRIF